MASLYLPAKSLHMLTQAKKKLFSLDNCSLFFTVSFSFILEIANNWKQDHSFVISLFTSFRKMLFYFLHTCSKHCIDNTPRIKLWKNSNFSTRIFPVCCIQVTLLLPFRFSLKSVNSELWINEHIFDPFISSLFSTKIHSNPSQGCEEKCWF